MTYETLLDEALAALPEFKKKYDLLVKEDIIDEESGMHIVFGYVFTPMLEEAIQAGNNADIQEMCDFLEKMAASDDVHVQEVCDQSVLERICSIYPDKKIIPFIGNETYQGLLAVRQYIDEP